jgi:hypothetical protein
MLYVDNIVVQEFFQLIKPAICLLFSKKNIIIILLFNLVGVVVADVGPILIS